MTARGYLSARTPWLLWSREVPVPLRSSNQLGIASTGTHASRVSVGDDAIC